MKRAVAVVVLTVLASMMLVTAVFANENPTTECGENPKYNKYQIGGDGSVGGLESNIGTVVTLTANDAGERIYDYANTNTAEWTLFRIVLKHGQTASDPINDPSQSGTVDAESDISHITFCLRAAEAPPEENTTPPPTENTGTPTETPGGSTEVAGEAQVQQPQPTAVLGVGVQRPQATAEAEAAMIAATGWEDSGLTAAAIGLILMGSLILRMVPARTAGLNRSS